MATVRKYGKTLQGIVLLGVAAASTAGWSDEAVQSSQIFVISGSGNHSCADLRTYINNVGEPQRNHLVEWIKGYASGLNRYHDSGDVLSGRKAESVGTAVIDWCANNPWKTVFVATDSVLGIKPGR